MTESLLASLPRADVTFPHDAVSATEFNCGIILTTDGSFKVFQSGPDSATDGDANGRYEMERKCLALAVAASNEQLMAILYDVMDNTDVLTLLREPAGAA